MVTYEFEIQNKIRTLYLDTLDLALKIAIEDYRYCDGDILPLNIRMDGSVVYTRAQIIEEYRKIYK